MTPLLGHTLLLEVDVKPWVDWAQAHRLQLIWAAAALVALLVLRRAWLAVIRRIRRSRPARIHPLLAKYSIDQAELDQKRRERASSILATSTGNRLAGFTIVRQVEAVVVEGYRSPEDAIIALKAAAAERGANAVLNVQTQRTAAGRCTASGDAVVVMAVRPRPVVPPPAPPPKFD